MRFLILCSKYPSLKTVAFKHVPESLRFVHGGHLFPKFNASHLATIDARCFILQQPFSKPSYHPPPPTHTEILGRRWFLQNLWPRAKALSYPLATVIKQFQQCS